MTLNPSQTPTIRAEHTTFPALDTLRAIGAIAVLATHTAFWAGSYTQHGVIGRSFARFDVGVALFFVLSGFLLSRPWLIRGAHGIPSPALGRYYFKRVLRIMPVYVVTAVLALALIPANRDRDFGAWVTTLSLFDIYVHQGLPSGLTQMWSLATEVAFYAVLPLMMLIAVGKHLRPTRVIGVLLLMCAFAVMWHLSLAQRVPGAEHRAVHEWLPAFLTWFAIGIGLALLQVLHSMSRLRPAVARFVDGAASTPGSIWLAAGGLFLIATSTLAGPTMLAAPTETETLTKNLLYGGIGGLLVFSGVFTTDNKWTTAMSHPAARHLGHLSYGIFCIHLPLLHLVMWITGYELFDGHLIQISLITLVLSVLAAEAIYRWVETPFMRLKNFRLMRIHDFRRSRGVAEREPTATAAHSAPSETKTR